MKDPLIHPCLRYASQAYEQLLGLGQHDLHRIKWELLGVLLREVGADTDIDAQRLITIGEEWVAAGPSGSVTWTDGKLMIAAGMRLAALQDSK